MVSGAAVSILTLSEQPSTQPSDDFPYSQNQTSGLSWQVATSPQWQAMARVAHSTWVGVMQRRSDSILLLQARPAAGASAAQVAAVLRFVSLSMDVKYQALQISNSVNQPPSQDVLRTIATVQGANGAAWTWDVTQSNNQIYQDATLINQNGGATIREIYGPGGGGVLLDEQRHVYQMVSGPTNYQYRSKGMTEIAYDTNSLLASGQLWDLGPKTVTLGDGRVAKVYDLYLVDKASPEHVYVDVTTNKVVAIWIDANSQIAPGGSASDAPYVDRTQCAPNTVIFTWLLYVTPPNFNTGAPQNGWNPGSVAPPFTCGG
jgi:hypothetical protein